MERRARPQEPGEPNLSPGIIELQRGVFSDILPFLVLLWRRREVVGNRRYRRSLAFDAKPHNVTSPPVSMCRLGDKRSQTTKKVEIQELKNTRKSNLLALFKMV